MPPDGKIAPPPAAQSSFDRERELIFRDVAVYREHAKFDDICAGGKCIDGCTDQLGIGATDFHVCDTDILACRIDNRKTRVARLQWFVEPELNFRWRAQ